MTRVSGNPVRRLEVRCRHRLSSGFALDFDFTSEHPNTALFGPSGAGKTSLLMALAGFLRPDEGRLAHGGHVLFDSAAGINEKPEVRRIGVVFQDQRLFPHLTVADNLDFGRRRRGAGNAPDLARIVSTLELGALLSRLPERLSGGERQRVALGRALMSSPDLLLLDEPVAAVDEPHRETILHYVARAAEEWRVPMLYVSHHRAEVQRLADWVIAVDDGRVIEQGPPETVLGADAMVGAGEAVNLLRLDEVIEENGTYYGALAGEAARLRLNPAGRALKTPLFVQFAASDVMLASGETRGLSARNQLPGTVSDLVPRAGRVFVSLRVGEQTLWAELTAEAVADLQLTTGTPVTCLIKSAALRIVS